MTTEDRGTAGRRLRPFLKWAGGKYSLLDRLLPLLPEGNRLVEPFAGSGAVFLNTAYKRAWLADANKDVIGCYRALADGTEDFIAAARHLFTPANNSREAYEAHRARFNASTDAFERAVLFIYLNRHGYNGLCRYNKSGGFNVPFGRYTAPYFPETELRGFLARLKACDEVILEVADFRQVFAGLNPGDVVYCDPPYAPLSATANFAQYEAGDFGPDDQRALARAIHTASGQGVPVVLSNHDTPFVMTTYISPSSKVYQFEARRSISCAKRRPAPELLAVYGA